MPSRGSNIGLSLAYVFSGLSLSVGTLGFVDPIQLSSQFGIPLPADAAIESTSYVRVYGSRNIALGASLLSLCLFQERRAAGILTICGVVNVLADAYLTQAYRGNGWLEKEVLSHFGFVPVVLVAGILLVKG
jgi:Domain of unknown function (DUF4267)